MKHFGYRMLVVVGALWMFAAAPARADDAQPWADGVSAERKTTAQGLLQEGNAAFLDRNYAVALDKYRQAIAAWDHPAIRFNVVRCLIQLDRPVEASDNLALALKYGAAPLDEAVYTEALSYQKLLATQIGDLEVTCAQPGLAIALDGKSFASCPTTETRRVTPGTHQLVGTKDGYLTRTLEITVLGGKRQRAEVSLVPLSQAGRIERRWARWRPWAVVGGGLVVAGVGGLIQLQASTNLDSYARAIDRDCAGQGCAPGTISPSVTDLRSTAERQNKLAIVMGSLGVATVATGAVLLFLNRGRTVFPGSTERITPSVTPISGGATVSVGRRF